MWGRKLGIGSALAASAVALSGCVVFQSDPTAKQKGVIGPVVVTVKVCASQMGNSSPPPGSCTNSNGNSNHAASTDPSQLFLGFRVPKGSGAPPSFKATTGPTTGGPQLHFTASAPYTDELKRLDKAPAGQEWIGYTSEYFSYDSTTGQQSFATKVKFGLPRKANGAPFKGPFTYLTVVGGRQYAGSQIKPSPDEPIDCEDSLTTGFGGPGTDFDWVCIDDPSPSAISIAAALLTRDAGIVPGKPVSVAPGKAASARFKFEYAGSATPSAKFTFGATTTVKGASAAPNIKTLTPTSNSTTPVAVSVKVPSAAHTGNYVVKLIAKLADGESRTGTVTLTVH
jgi:hypothetical protein